MKTAQENCEIFFHQILNVPERVSNANGLYLLRNSAQFRAIPHNSAQQNSDLNPLIVTKDESLSLFFWGNTAINGSQCYTLNLLC